MPQFKALGEYLIVRPIFEIQSDSIIIPKSAMIYKRYKGKVVGEVLSVGSRVNLDKAEDRKLKAGDIIIYQKHEGYQFWMGVERAEYIRLHQHWVMAWEND